MQGNILSSKKRMRIILIGVIIACTIIIIKIGYIQFVQGSDLQQKALEQQFLSRTIPAARGTIYDSTEENILALSSTVMTITVNPMNIQTENKEKVAKALTEIFELEYEKVLKKVNKKSSIEIIAKRVEEETADELRKWISENNIYNGINIDEDTKRYYPYSTLASHIIGFCGSDNQGLDGLEAKYDSILKGKNGKINKMMDAKGGDFGDEGEQYEKPIAGNDIVLTIDKNIQAIVEKHLENACIDNICTDGGNIIVMNPKNGDILAMATYPYYDLNLPYEIADENIQLMWDVMDRNQKSNVLQSIWRNKAIADTYEPGSTFKLVTSAAAIEEGLAEVDKERVYNCGGGIEIAGRRIKCWRHYRPHGMQSLREGLMNSCNPVFVMLGQKLGVDKYYEYLGKFGFLDKTGIDLNGEAKSIFVKKEKAGPVELATISFGQRFEVTPIQMVTMISTIANNGRYVKPRLVKKIIDNELGEVTIVEPEFGSQVISEKTAKDILSMCTSVVAEGTGKNARVQGYSIGGKTGTSEDGVNTGKYVTSFLGVAPTENPVLTILITLYNPTGEGGHQGGAIAAPIAGKVFEEIISYLELKQNY